MKFNEMQELAKGVRDNGGDILISAGAGSGKTAVLSERVLRLITDPENPVDIDRLLIMTFTQNAAAEMRERIHDKLQARKDELILTGGSAGEIANIQRQLSLLNKANISTIDAYSNNLVKQYFYMVDIDPTYRIGGSEDSPELSQLSNDLLEEMTEEKLKAEDDDFISLLDFFSPESNNIEDLNLIIKKIHQKLSSLPFPLKWIKDNLKPYPVSPDEVKDRVLSSVFEDITELCSPHKTEFDEMYKAASSLSLQYSDAIERQRSLDEDWDNIRYPYYCNMLEYVKPLFEALDKDIPDFNALYTHMLSPMPALSKRGILGKVIGKVPELKEFCEEVNGLINLFKNKLIPYFKTNHFDVSFDNKVERMVNTGIIAHRLMDLYVEYTLRLMDKKREKGIFSFSDISHFCIEILYNEDMSLTQTAYNLKKEFKYIIVDEYQDNNYLQEYMLSALSSNNLFMVGDVKQSIYGFREACPDIFAGKYNSFNHCTSMEAAQGDICINLNENYRSRSQVLEFANFIFYQLMSREFGGIDYDKATALKAGYKYPSDLDADTGLKNELIILEKPIKTSKSKDTQEDTPDILAGMDNDELYAYIIAERISKLVDPENPTPVYDKKLEKYRPCRLSDIAILAQSLDRVSNLYISVLGSYGIPVISRQRFMLFSTMEIKTIMSLLKIVDNPYQDMELITVLLSPICNITNGELARLKTMDKSGLLYDNILKYAEEEASADPSLVNKLNSLITLIENANGALERMPIPEAVIQLLQESNYLNYLSLINNSHIRLNNVHLLEGFIEDMCSQGIISYRELIRQLTRLEAKDSEAELPSVRGDNEGVSFMSIHGSKGLEFPIVFLTQVSKNLRINDDPKKDNNKALNFYINSSVGFAFDYFNVNTRELYPNKYKQQIMDKAREINLVEKLRLLYVAITRAEQKLIMVGHVSNLDNAVSDAAERRYNLKDSFHISPEAIKEKKTFLDWILMAIAGEEQLNNYLSAMEMKTIRLKDVFDGINGISKAELASMINSSAEVLGNRTALISIPDNSSLQMDKRSIVHDRLTYRYFDEESVNLISKVSISEIKRQHMIEAYAQLEEKLNSEAIPSLEHLLEVTEGNKKRDTQITFKTPDFITETKEVLTGVERGTAYHTVFEHLNLDPNADVKSIEEQIKALREQNILSKAEFNSVSADKFYDFIHCELGQRLCASKGVYRETPFVMFLPPNEVFPSREYTTKRGMILTHGIIDLYFEEEDHIILVDYKTDRVKENNTVEQICDRYRIQLEYYRDAIQKATDKPVKESYLYLVDISQPALVEKY